MSNQTITLLQATLDENKEDIPEGLYLRICNLNKKLMEENELGVDEEEKKNCIYKIEYVEFSVVPCNLDQIGNFEIKHRYKTAHLPLCEHIYQEIKQNLTGDRIVSGSMFDEEVLECRLNNTCTKLTVPYIDGVLVEDEQCDSITEYIVSVPFTIHKKYMIHSIEKV